MFKSSFCLYGWKGYGQMGMNRWRWTETNGWDERTGIDEQTDGDGWTDENGRSDGDGWNRTIRQSHPHLLIS